ncbi:uncharacterized protein [Rutidosis leptorrhynchoides]|uniref:uncharacterized protein isoform X5 n=1 Tax=Rutidosis leptorrhynchoides TaxID=125765 RepID=UPI003A98F3C7
MLQIPGATSYIGCYWKGQHFAMNRSLIANLSAAATNKIFTMNLSAPFICEFVKDAQEKALPYVDLFLETKPKQEHSQRFMARID